MFSAESSFIAVCYYTPEYAEEAKLLLESCDDHNVPCKIYGYDSRGSWQANTSFKPVFLQWVIDQHDCDIVYLDADARIRKYPRLFDVFTADIGVHYKDGHELLSGTIYLKNNDTVRSILNEWVSEQRSNPNTWDQKILQRVLEKYNVQELPASYCQIFDSMAHNGEPVIEHLQASRRLKETVKMNLPTDLWGAKLRYTEDGKVFLVRNNKKAEAYLDSICTRVGPLKWMPKQVSTLSMENVALFFRGKIVNIVGKGKSLDYFKGPDNDGPIIALNESIHAIEKLGLNNPTLCLQQDAKLGSTCQPKRAIMLVSTHSANHYANYQRTIVFNSTDLGIQKNALSAEAAIAIAKQQKATAFKLYCFDACVNRDTRYADCIGYSSSVGGTPARFYEHRERIEKLAGDLPITWVTPVDPSDTFSDIVQQ